MGNEPFDATAGDPVTVARSFQAEIADRAAAIEESRQFTDELASLISSTKKKNWNSADDL